LGQALPAAAARAAAHRLHLQAELEEVTVELPRS
jgi:hypothetical protein